MCTRIHEALYHLRNMQRFHFNLSQNIMQLPFHFIATAYLVNESSLKSISVRVQLANEKKMQMNVYVKR